MPEPLDYRQQFKSLFATRLISQLRARGFVSRLGIGTANGKQLAKAIGVSLPMARRYINAKSIPENKTLQKMARWLDVDPNWLLYGDDPKICSHHKDIDREFFKGVFERLFPLLCNANLTKEKYITIIMGGLDIYCHVLAMAQDEPKDRAISLMVDFLKKNL